VDNQTERVQAEMVSGNFFSMLGVRAAIGRVFTSGEDDRVYQGHPVVALSYPYWSTRFARDPGVVGKKILVNNYPMTIVGVSAAGFVGLDPARSPQIRVPILMKPVVAPEWSWLQVDDRRARWVQVFARLLATALAVIGLYGVMAFVVTRRTKELGVRLALGAQRRSVIWLVMKEVLTLVAIGLIVGVPSAMGLGRVKKMKETQMRIEN
jgi:MacB-like periplasmic core domain/FtsX-like permease family